MAGFVVLTICKGTNSKYVCLTSNLDKMRAYLPTLAILIFTSFSAVSQINLIGTAVNTNTSDIEVLEWQALDPNSVVVHGTELDAYLMASSVFDAYNGNYYLGGISNDNGVLLQFNSMQDSQSLIDFDLLSNVAEIDMSTGLLYSLAIQTEGEIRVLESDFNTNQEVEMGVILEPGVQGIVVDALGFDSNSGIIYYVGYDNTPSTCLYAIPVRDDEFSFVKTTLTGLEGTGSVTSVHYDNVNNRLFALYMMINDEGFSAGNKVIEIDLLTGEVTDVVELTGFNAFLGGSSSYDQNSGNMLLVGFGSGFNAEMIVVNTITNTFETGFVPDNVSEIVCDNRVFAASAYNINSVSEVDASNLSVFPNPISSGELWIAPSTSEDAVLSIKDLSGKLCYTQNGIKGSSSLNVEFLNPGCYMVSLTGAKGVHTARLIVE